MFTGINMKLFQGNLEEDILRILIKSEITTHQLIVAVALLRGTVTKQGIYRCLRKLIKEKKIIEHKSVLQINIFWINQLENFISNRKISDLVVRTTQLKLGEKISLKVTGLLHADMIWSNIFSEFETLIEKERPMYVYNPHNWFIFINEETEKIHAERITKKRRIFYSIKGKTALDNVSIKLMKNINITGSSASKNYGDDYIVVIDDYILYLSLSKKSNIIIDDLFEETKKELFQKQFLSIENRIPGKIIIERNSTKAMAWKKKISSDFYIPKNIKDF